MHTQSEKIAAITTLKITSIATHEVMQIRAGAPDANGQQAVLQNADGGKNPCRHCLQLIEAGSPMLVLAYRPFARLQPYSELGPIFLHQQICARYQQPHFPAWFNYMDPALVRGYDSNDWICYETGAAVAGRDLAAYCAAQNSTAFNAGWIGAKHRMCRPALGHTGCARTAVFSVPRI